MPLHRGRNRLVADAVAAYEASAGALLAVGQTIHVNHEGCLAGVDARRRLYITRKMTDSGHTTDLAYCHNCGAGFVNGDSTPNVRSLGSTPGLPLAASTPPSLLELPDNLVLAGTEGFPGEADEFLAPIAEDDLGPITNCGGTWGHEDFAAAGIGFNRSNGRLLLPIYTRLDGHFGAPSEPVADDLLGWQERRLYGNGPKYITTDNGAPLETMVHLWDDAPLAIVFVEDYLSAIRVSQSHGSVLAVPLLRYKVRAERVAELAKSKLPAIVWLDNDRPEVKAEAEHLERLWKALGNKAIRDHSIEPKKALGGLAWMGPHVDSLISTVRHK